MQNAHENVIQISAIALNQGLSSISKQSPITDEFQN